MNQNLLLVLLGSYKNQVAAGFGFKQKHFTHRCKRLFYSTTHPLSIKTANSQKQSIHIQRIVD